MIGQTIARPEGIDNAVPIGVAAARVLKRTATMVAFRDMLSRCPDTERRSRLVSAAFANGTLTDDERRAFSAEG